jgi:hypothetical protein
MKGKQLLTTGLAAVATIHAAHGVYQSVEKRAARQKAVKEGRLSPAEAKKLKTKAMMQDAASVGIAALGVKGAIDEFKQVRNISHECSEFQLAKALRHQRREEKRKLLHEGGSVEGGSSSGRRRAESWAAPRRRPYDDDDDDGYKRDDDDDDLLDDPAYHRPPRYMDGNPYRSNTLPAPPLGGRGR